MTSDKNELVRGLSDWNQREADLRNATGETELPAELKPGSKATDEQQQEAADYYMKCLMTKRSPTPAEIAYIKNGLSEWSQANRR